MKITVLSVKPDAAARKRSFRFTDNGDGVKIAEIRNKETYKTHTGAADSAAPVRVYHRQH